MPNRPLLKLPAPEPFVPKRPVGGGSAISLPTRERQAARLDPKFEQLARVASSPEKLLELRADPASIAPERAIVFEVEGSLDDFYAQARDLGLEYLGDFEETFQPTEDFFNEEKPEKPLSARIYLAMPSVQSLNELLSLWQRYKQKKNMPRGKSAWRILFSKLIDIRPWGPQDRIDSESIAAWEMDLQNAPDQTIRLEVELWYHESQIRRRTAFAQVQQAINDSGGVVIHHAVISEIHYDAALVDLPADQVRNLIEHQDISLARADEVMFLRPQSIITLQLDNEGTGDDNNAPLQGPAFTAQQPVAALLDGLPIQNHARLAGRIRVDDPANLEPSYPVVQRRHGTEMASLIIHGDLNHHNEPISRPLYVRPILQPNVRGDERSSDSRLLVDVIYQAVRRMKVGEGGDEPTAPDVKIINFSIGDPTRPFATIMSPLARLLDYLSYQFGVLFLVSAGNILDRLSLPEFRTSADFEAASLDDREKAILNALNANKSQRTLLSPAEAMNVLTIGASHAGSAFNGNLPAGMYDPFTSTNLPNIVSAMGLGFKKVIKPELLFDGGRAPVRIVASNPEVVIQPVSGGACLFGAKVAQPSPTGSVRYEDYSWGTSVATALATHSAHRVHDVLADINGGSNHGDIDPAYMALILKALLVHCGKWGDKGELLEGLFGPRGTGGAHLQRRDDIARLLGYGVANVERVLDCTESRATLVGYGTIEAGQGILYRIPLPEDLNGVLAFRAVTTTLAWFSPVNPRHQGYRTAALDVSSASDDKYWIASERSPYQPTDKAIARGTVFHERRTAEEATIFLDDGYLLLRISCRETAGTLATPIPYALAVSFEVGVQSGIRVYEQIRERLANLVRSGIRAQA